MDRRRFLASAAAAAAAACSSAEQVAPAKPNVLILYTDEHSWWTLGAYGGKLLETPHIDSIGREGAIFNNFFVNSAVCTPSRGCLITGRYPHAHGAWQNNIELNRDEVTLAHVFQGAGYETGMAGKWHLDGEPKPGWMSVDRDMGFEDVEWMYNRGHWKRIVEKPEGWPENRSNSRFGNEDHIAPEPDGRPDIDYDVNAEGEFFTDWITDKCIEFLERPREEPYFYYLSIPDPHTPWTVRGPYDAMYDPDKMPVPDSLYEENLPDWAEPRRQDRLRPERAESWDDPVRAEYLKRNKAVYLGQVKCIDDNVGRILDSLRRTGQLDNTLIVFTSDHGQYMGEHGLYMKNALYETAHRVAMLMRWPEKIPAGTAVNECVSTVDVQPTLCALAGVEPSGREQGHDASHLAMGHGDSSWADEAFIHHSSLSFAGIFTPDWEFALAKKGDGILFDRRNDPEQLENLIDERPEVVAELTARVVEHNRAVEAPALEWLENG